MEHNKFGRRGGCFYGIKISLRLVTIKMLAPMRPWIMEIGLQVGGDLCCFFWNKSLRLKLFKFCIDKGM